MTVASYAAAPPRVRYDEDGVTVLHSVPFQFFDAAELTVTRILVDGTEILLTTPTHYSVAGGNGEVGSITKISGGVDGAVLQIDRNTALSQLAVYAPGDDFPSDQTEEAFDRLEMEVQEIRRDLLTEDDIFDILVATLIAGDQISFDVDAEGGTITINNDMADPDVLAGLLGGVLLAGFGIELTEGAGTITIASTVTSVGEQDALLLASSVGDGSTGAEDVRTIMAATLVGLGLTIAVDDIANTITIDATQGVTLEVIRDAIGSALVAGSGVTVTVDDAGNTITIAVDDERIRDAIGTCLVAGSGVSITVDDGANTITIAASGLDATYKGIVPTVQSGAFDFSDAMNGRATTYDGSAANATLRDEADVALADGWTHVVWVSPGDGPLTIHRDTAVALYVNGAVVSADATIAAGGQATIHRKADDVFTIVGVGLT